MIKVLENPAELKNAIDTAVKGKSRLISFDEILMIIPEKRKSKGIRGILSGLIDKKAVDLTREERESWR